MEVVNEKKLKNDEVWGHIGKPDLCEKVEGIQESGTSSQVTRDDNSDSVSNGEPKLLQTSQFTEEFDFQAMNEKFNKDEIWEYLAKVNIRDRPDGIHKIGTSSNGAWTDTPDLVSNKDRKPAYNKDDFFDTISVNSEGHGSRNGHNQSSAFVDSQRRTQSGYSGLRAGQGEHHGRAQHSWGRGYNHRYRGRGGYRQR